MDVADIPIYTCTTSDVAKPVENGTAPAEEPTKAQEVVKKTRLVTVEPVLYIFMFGLGIFYPAFQGLAYYKICMQEYNDSYICNNLHNKSHAAEEDVVQAKSSHFFLYEQLCFEIPAITLSFFYGILSDRTSRKLTLAMPGIGQALAMTVFILNSVYIESDVRYLLLGRFIIGIFGGWISCCLASFSYLSAVTTEKDRTTRISVAEGVINIGFAKAYILSGIILDNTSYVFVFSFVAGINILLLIYIAIWVQEPMKCPTEMNIQEARIDEMESKKGCCAEALRHTVDAVTCVFRRREGNRRKQLLVLLASVFTGMVSYEVMWSLGYLYVKRQPLSWSQTLFGIYVGYWQAIQGVFLLFFIPLMKTRLHFRDTTLILMALCSSAGAEVLYSISVVTWMVFLVPVIGIMASTKMTCMRSLLSTLVPTQELGQMFAAVGSLQSISGIVGSLIFNTIYPVTLHFWAGFSFTLGACLTVIPLSLVSWLHKDLKKSEDNYETFGEADGLAESEEMTKTTYGGP